MNNIAQNLEPLKNKLRNHSLYNSIESIEDLKIFTNAHVYAVWDFMSLLKFLQINLTSISVPWYPSNNTSTAKLINEIVAGEETDENEQGKPMSHFEMYLDSIESFGVKTDVILNNINSLNTLNTINNDIEKSLGKLLGLQSKHLNNFMHIQAMRKFEWDPSNISWVKKYINLFSGLKKNVIFEAINQHLKFVKKNKC